MIKLESGRTGLDQRHLAIAEKYINRLVSPDGVPMSKEWVLMQLALVALDGERLAKAEPQGAPTHCGCCLNLIAACSCPKLKGAPFVEGGSLDDFKRACGIVAKGAPTGWLAEGLASAVRESTPEQRQRVIDHPSGFLPPAKGAPQKPKGET